MVIVIMGVAGAGKTTVGERLAAAIGANFYDADDFHSPSAIAKMQDGHPLTDADRDPWLERLEKLIQQIGADQRQAILACSALKGSYQARLRAAAEGAGIRVVFIHLEVTPEIALARLRKRRGHFMPARLVESQFAILEPPEDAITVNAAAAPHLLVEQIQKALERRLGPVRGAS
ncbi:MAG TPA: gluconokinase [Candidatus Acidoferrales bacterium]|nr:gluconokinase [Candidatus Acidoferrales bacterium]